MTGVTSGAGESKLNKYTLLGAFRDFVLLVKNFVLFDYSNGKYPQESSSSGITLSTAYKQAIAATRATRKKRVPNRLTRKSTMCLRQKMLGALKA